MKKKISIIVVLLLTVLLTFATAGCFEIEVKGKTYEYDSCSCVWKEGTTIEQKAKLLNNQMTEKEFFNTLSGGVQTILSTAKIHFTDEQNFEMLAASNTTKYIYVREGNKISFTQEDSTPMSFYIEIGKLSWKVDASELQKEMDTPIILTVVFKEQK